MQDAGGIVGYMDMDEDGAVKITNSFYDLSNTKIGDKTRSNVKIMLRVLLHLGVLIMLNMYHG